MKRNSWKITILVVIVAIVLIGVALSGPISKKVHQVEAFYSKKVHTAINAKLYEGFKKTADAYNKKGPTMVSKTLRLDKTAAGPGARITYYYTFTNYSSHDLDPDKLNANLKTKLVNPLCQNKKVKPTLELGATYVFVYSGNDGAEVTHIEINNKSCSS